jgi:SpoIID/LytB domain protein
MQPAPPVKYYDKEPVVRVALLLNHREVYLNIPEKFSIQDGQDNILAQDLLGKKWRVRAASNGTAAPSLEMREVGDQQSFVFPSGFEILTARLAATDNESGLGNGATRYYLGRMRFIVNGQNISAINILPMEEYLRGVVPSEMSASFPMEALKAQAIACRSEVLHRLPATSGKEYDICADEGCQVYAGTSRQAESVDKAIRATKGLVLKSGGQIVTAPYAGVCGGFTENNEAVWSGKPRSHLRGRFDGKRSSRQPQSLESDGSVRQWLAEESDAHCNLMQGEVPRSLAYARGYFRWQRQFSAAELAGNIKRKTNEDAGTLLELLPLQRGASGRVTKIRVVGSRKSFEIGGELAIRQALSPQALPSALFVVEKAAGDTNGRSGDFIIRGGGWGHGVGMCQVGAAMQALQGKLYQNILEFYYKNARLARAY